MHGNFCGASALVMAGVSSPEVAEVIACREGLALAQDLGAQKIRVASDCANAVRSIQGPGMGEHGHIVKEIRREMTNFTKVQFIHEGRRSNVDAHNLARSSVYNAVGRFVWLLAPPPGVCTSFTD